MACPGAGNTAGALAAYRWAKAVFPNVSVMTPLGPKRLPTIMTAIAGAESGWRTNPSSPPYVGLWQIGAYQIALMHRLGFRDYGSWVHWLTQGWNNAKAAHMLMVLRGGSLPNKLNAWSTWDGGQGVYLECFPGAEAAEATAEAEAANPTKRRPKVRTASLWIPVGVSAGAAASAVLLGLFL